MEDLFAMEGDLSCPEVLAQPETLEMRSVEDPVFIKDHRILKNILNRQELLSCKEDYFATVQEEIKPHMRKIVSDWMLEVCEEQRCQPEVFHLATNYMDRFLSQLSIGKHQFQLLGCVCLFLASKFKETCPLPAENLVIYTVNSVTVRDITSWELMVLNVLRWDLSAVTAHSILDQLLRCIELQDQLKLETVRQHAETFVALAATEHIFIQKSPALVAVASLAAALRGLSCQTLDDAIHKMELTTGVKAAVIKDCMNQIEVSISMSMSGTSFQPETGAQKVMPPPPPATTTPKMKIPARETMNNNCAKEEDSSSKTPTDLMEITEAF